MALTTLFCMAALQGALSYVSAESLGLDCAPGTKPSLLHTFVGKFADDDQGTGTYGDDVAKVHNNWGGFVLFRDTADGSVSPTDGVEIYWDSAPHVGFGGLFVDALTVDEDGRGADTVQLSLCVEEDPSATGAYHTGVVVDVGKTSGDCDAHTVLAMLEAIPVAEGGSSTDKLCGVQWPGYTALTFSDGIDGFDRNKKMNVEDSGCVFNFISADARDAFVSGLAPYIDEIKALPCVVGTIAYNME